MPDRNREVALLLGNITKLLALKGEDAFRVKAYTEASQTIAHLPEDVEQVHRSGRLADVPGIGESIASKISEYLDTGRSEYYDGLKQETGIAAPELLDVPSIGPERARGLFERLGVRTAAELAQAAQDGRLRDLPGFGPKLEERIGREAAEVARLHLRGLLAGRRVA